MFQDSTGGNPNPIKPTDISNPLDLAKALKDALVTNVNFLKGLQEIDAASFKIAKNFGLTKNEIDNITKATTLATDELVKFGASQQTAFEQQLSVGKALQRNLILGTEAQKDLFLASQTSGQAADKIAGSFKDAGFSLYDTGKQMNTVVNTAREIGVNASIVSEKVLQNTSLLNKYNFEGGVQGLAKMAANASALRVDMGETLKFAEKVYNPEGAIEAAAALQRLGVAQSDLLDPLRLIDLAENDPTELQNQISEMSKQFVRLNEQGNFEILPGAKRQIREIEQALGFSNGELSKMALSSAELDTKLSKIKFPDFATEEQKKLLANITEMKDGQVKINVGGKLEDIDTVLNKVSSKEEFQKLIEQGEKKSPEKLAELQLSATDRLTIAIEELKNRIPRAMAREAGGQALLELSTSSVEKMTKGLGGYFEKIQPDLTKVLSDSFLKMTNNLNKLFEGDFSLKNITELLDTATKSLTKIGEITLGPAFDKIVASVDSLTSGTKTFADFIGKLKDSEIFKEILKKGEEVKEKITGNDVIITPDKEIQLLPQDTIIAGTGLDFLKDIINPTPKPSIIQSISNTLGFNPSDFANITKTTSEPVTKTSPSEVTVNFKMSLDISGPNSSQIDTNKILLVLNDQSVKEKLVQVTKEAMTERGQRIIYE
jgi:hypothetical protein